jgi:putative endonuclease
MRNLYFYVYIVECSDGSYYTGITNDVERRIEEHNSGNNTNSYTYTRRPVVLKYATHFYDFNQAEAWEKQIKGWTRRKKEALMSENWNQLIEFSKSKTKE